METNPILTSGEIEPIKDLIKIEYTVVETDNALASEILAHDNLNWGNEDIMVSMVAATCLGGELILNYKNIYSNTLNRYAFADFANLTISNNYLKALNKYTELTGEDIAQDYIMLYGNNNKILNLDSKIDSSFTPYWNYDESKWIESAVRPYSTINANSTSPSWQSNRPHFGDEILDNCYYFTKIEVEES